MKFIDWSARTQARRIGVSFVCASLLAYLVSAAFGLPLIPYARVNLNLHETLIHLLYRCVPILLVTATLLLHLFLCKRHFALAGETLFQFSLARLVVCMVALSLFVGANFLPIFSTSESWSFGGSVESITKVTTYGFPAQIQVVREINHLSTRTYVPFATLSIVGIAINAAILLLFMANVLVLKFVKTETAASATESAPQNASH